MCIDLLTQLTYLIERVTLLFDIQSMFPGLEKQLPKGIIEQFK